MDTGARTPSSQVDTLRLSPQKVFVHQTGPPTQWKPRTESFEAHLPWVPPFRLAFPSLSPPHPPTFVILLDMDDVASFFYTLIYFKERDPKRNSQSANHL